MKTLKRSKGQRVRISTSMPGVDKRFLPIHQNFEGNRSTPTAKKSFRPAKSTGVSGTPVPSRSTQPLSKPKRQPKLRPKRSPIKWQAIERRCWLILGLVFALSVWLSPVTQPVSLRLRGVPSEGQAELKSLLESCWHAPFAMNTGYGSLQLALAQTAWVQDAHIQPELDGGLSGVVIPRTAVAKIITPDQVFWLDENGYAFAPPNPKEHRGVKTMRLQYLPSVQFGKPVEDEALRKALDCLEQLKASDLPQKVVFDINLEREICLNISGLSTGRTLQVRLGDASDIAEQFQSLTQLFRQKPQLLAQCEYLDLQCPTAPAIKRAGAGREPDSSTGGNKP